MGQRLEDVVARVADQLDNPGTVIAPQVVGPRGRHVGLAPHGVAQVDEEQATVVAFGCQPSRQPHPGADVVGREGAAAGVAVAVGNERVRGMYAGHVAPRLPGGSYLAGAGYGA